jgi:hypothetical protein
MLMLELKRQHQRHNGPFMCVNYMTCEEQVYIFTRL